MGDRNATALLDAVRGSPGVTLSVRQVGGRMTLALRGLEGTNFGYAELGRNLFATLRDDFRSAQFTLHSGLP